MTTRPAPAPPQVKRGAARQTQAARPAPKPEEVKLTVWRDGLTGRFAKDPATLPQGGAVALDYAAPGQDTQVFRHVIDWGDGSAPEVVSVAVSSLSGRAARLLGELTASALRELEGGLELSTLQEVAPARAREAELEAMHAAHRTDKSKRGAVSRKRNAEARAKDAQRKGRG